MGGRRVGFGAVGRESKRKDERRREGTLTRTWGVLSFKWDDCHAIVGDCDLRGVILARISRGIVCLWQAEMVKAEGGGGVRSVGRRVRVLREVGV